MRLNSPAVSTARTHEGAFTTVNTNPRSRLRRSVFAALLWEREFYEDGVSIAERIEAAARQVTIDELAEVALEARQAFHLRHVPLLLLTVLIDRGRGNPIVKRTIESTISRADELTELVALYWRRGKRPLSAQLKQGIAGAFRKFDEYQLAKYDRRPAVRLRDVLFLSHAKPKDEKQARSWKALVDKKLPAPVTWEVELSAGKDKQETFERLL